MNTDHPSSPTPAAPPIVVGNAIPSKNINGGSAKKSETDAAFSADFNLELLRLTTENLSEDQLRAQVRFLAIKFAGAVGAGHVICDDQGDWDVKPKYSSGRLPRRHDFLTQLSSRCADVVKQQTIQVDPLPQVEGCYGIFAPLLGAGLAPEILFLLIPDSTENRRPFYVVGKLLHAFTACLKNNSMQQQDWKVASLSALIELISATEGCRNISEAMNLVVNELSRYLGVSYVAMGEMTRGSLGTLALSGATKTDKRSETYHAFQQCISESILRDEDAQWPAPHQTNDELLLAHRQLAHQVNSESVLSFPLKTLDGKSFGAWLFVGDRDVIDSNRLRRFIQVSSPRVVNALQSVKRGQHPFWLRMIEGARGQLVRRKTQWLGLATIALTAAMFLPVPYRVRCNCSIEPEVRRFAVAPFDGMVLKGFVSAGDFVAKDQLMAEMDGQSIRYELAEVVAKQSIASKQRAIELADRDIPEMLLAELDGKRLEAEEQLLKFKRSHLKIKSPVEGVVLAGSLEQAEASAVRTGDVLFEVGSLEQLVILLEIPAEDIPQVEIGQQVTVWIEGRESKPLLGKLQKIRPQSERRDARNVFIGEIVLDEQEGVRPGMQGTAKIDGQVNSLGWNLFHKPLDYLRSRMSW